MPAFIASTRDELLCEIVKAEVLDRLDGKPVSHRAINAVLRRFDPHLPHATSLLAIVPANGGLDAAHITLVRLDPTAQVRIP